MNLLEMIMLETDKMSYPLSFERAARKLQARKNRFIHDAFKDMRKEKVPLAYEADYMMLIFNAVVIEVTAYISEMFATNDLYVVDNLLIKSLMDEKFRQKLKDGHFDNNKTTTQSSRE